MEEMYSVNDKYALKIDYVIVYQLAQWCLSYACNPCNKYENLNNACHSPERHHPQG